jgi:N-acetylglucosamine kinase-like BadF-type ATPase
MTRYALGIDGGGTKTRAAIIDEGGRLRGTGVGGPSNYDDVGVDTAQAGVAQAVDAARRAAGLKSSPFDAAFLGMAGVVSPDDRAIIRRIAQNLELAPVEQIGVDHDIRIALAGGLSGRPGIALIAGTGSSCYGRTAAGEGWRAGGWGQLISDEGSSYWLGVQAMKAAVRAYDGRIERTLLLTRVQERLRLADMNDIMHRIYHAGLSRAEIAALAPLVIDAARDGDQVAEGLIEQGAQALAECVLAVARRLGFTDGPCELALVGGLFRAGDIFTQPLKGAIWQRLPHCRIIPAEAPPVLGACVLALQSLGIKLDDSTLQALHEAASRIASEEVEET